MENNKMANLQTVRNHWFRGSGVWVPLIQRNYKWRPSTCCRLVEDLWEAWKKGQGHYTVGMITIHVGEDGKGMLVDGQQRIITLTLLLKILDRGGDHFKICFQRDQGLEEGLVSRRDYLENPGMELLPEELYTDLERFQENYGEIKSLLEDKENKESGNGEELRRKREEFAAYLYEHVYVILHIASLEPLDEFMNINCNKTRFGTADYIRAYQFMNAGDMNVERQAITELFRGLSEKLYSGRTKLWELVSRGYGGRKGEWPSDRNRLEILFQDRYREHGAGEPVSVKLAVREHGAGGPVKAKLDDLEHTRQEFEQLSWYNQILDTMLEDWNRGNWNSARAFLCLRELYDLEETRFFHLSILTPCRNHRPGGSGGLWGEEPVERKLLEKFDKLSAGHNCFARNCFIQTQMMGQKPDLNPGVSILPAILNLPDKESCLSLLKEWDEAEDPDRAESGEFMDERAARRNSWIWKGRDEWADFKGIYEEYIQEKYPHMTNIGGGD